MFRVAMNVTGSQSSGMFDSTKNLFEVVKPCVQLIHVNDQMSQIAFEVSDIVNVRRQSVKFVRVGDQVAVLWCVAVVNGLSGDPPRVVANLDGEPVNVSALVRVGVGSKCGHRNHNDERSQFSDLMGHCLSPGGWTSEGVIAFAVQPESTRCASVFCPFMKTQKTAQKPQKSLVFQLKKMGESRGPGFRRSVISLTSSPSN
jgi:hypothetical protein